MLDYTDEEQVLERYKTGHLWLGIVKNNENLEEYLQQEDLPNDNFCKFCKDIGLNEEYDEDFIVIFPVIETPVAVNKILETEVPLRNEEEITKAKTRCVELGIEYANTFIFYSDPNLTIDKNKKYNGLDYIGCFLAEF